MIPLGLSATDLRALNAALLTSHEIRVRVSLQDLNGDTVGDVTSLLLDGQINVDNSAAITRTASISLLDPTRSLSFESSSPNDAALFIDRMVRITYGVLVGGTWRDVPVFTGPITSLTRHGATVQVEASGKEALAMGAVWQPLTIRAGTRKTDAIKTILRERAGEISFDIPNLSTRLPKALSLARDATPWATVRWLAWTLGRQLYYDGRGTCRLRSWGGSAVFGWPASGMLSPLQVNYSLDSLVNAVWVQGGTPKGAKNPISYLATAPLSDALSPWRIGRNGVPRYLLQTIQDNSIRSTSEAATAAQAALSRNLLEGVQATFDSLPVPHLDPGDVVSAATDEGAITFALAQYSLPLSVGGGSTQPMSVGYLRNVSVRRRGSR